ncbi:hypothetical protein AMD27_08505 [Acinetobacter sp. TGL-Y2]|uniref:hypothetical protein n=1 Tax=Acinetobacter sp. TGL-Y2 TaxID=1407071 RepID=UPI0007A655A9|nr:hypothetical protein [Acinetobacter sp. TGL-Y2]AMW78914.1 hypothetical protein AMD27_08505 [Acinetobacter sp. TGL-Y2]
MKKILIPMLFSIAITGCQKEYAENPNSKTRFETSDALIGTYLDKLDSTSTSLEEKTQIACKDYPNEYKKNYMPALLVLSPDYTETELLKDLDTALDYYKSNLNIKCE